MNARTLVRYLIITLSLIFVFAIGYVGTGSPPASGAPPPTPAPLVTRIPVASSLPTVSNFSPAVPLHPQDPKLASPLAELRDAAAAAVQQGQPKGIHLPDQLPDDLKPLVQGKAMRINAAGDVQVYVKVAAADAALLNALQAAGLTVERVSNDLTLVQGWVSPNALSTLAASTTVESVRLPDYAFFQTGSVTTEGDAIIRANLARSTFGVSGAGVKVGVISDGVLGLAASQATGDLGSVDTSTCNVLGGNPTTLGKGEGTAMLEIVHDIAPGAQLYFAASATSLDFPNAVTCLAAHTDVVVDDVSFFNAGPYDGTSAVSSNTSTQLNLAGNPIRFYTTAVGNDAWAHYQEQFTDYGGTYSGWNKFQATANTTDALGRGPFPVDEFELQTDGDAYVFLQWNDSWGHSGNDYDLYLYDDQNGTLLQSSTNVQNGSGNPVESLYWHNTTGAVHDYAIAVQKHSGAALRTLDLFLVPLSGATLFPNDALLNFNTLSSSVPNQSDAGNGVVSVGAIDQANPGHDTIEPYSGRGTTNDGRIKPDITGIDNVCVSGAGGFGYGSCQVTGKQFGGTSAAAPHVAAVAALLLQCRPDLKSGGSVPASTARTDLRNYILSSAVALGSPIPNNTFGYGLIDAYNAAVAAGCTSVSTPTPTPTTGPTPTRTPFPAVGGLADAPDASLQQTAGSPSTAPFALGGIAAVAVLLLTSGAFYARRRWRAK